MNKQNTKLDEIMSELKNHPDVCRDALELGLKGAYLDQVSPNMLVFL